jgi:serine/threonine protein kinase
MALTSGTKLGPYEILAPLGVGGMGEVYKARDKRLNRVVAIKVLRSDSAPNASLAERFIREAKSASSLNHPNIVSIYDVFRHEDVDCLVMEYITGASSRADSDVVLRMLTTDGGLTGYPAISRDGKFVAFASDRSKENNLDIWVQQIGGGGTPFV